MNIIEYLCLSWYHMAPHQSAPRILPQLGHFSHKWLSPRIPLRTCRMADVRDDFSPFYAMIDASQDKPSPAAIRLVPRPWVTQLWAAAPATVDGTKYLSIREKKGPVGSNILPTKHHLENHRNRGISSMGHFP